MVEMIELFNQERVALGKAPIRMGIGIASGEVVAGYTGTQQRATYTCIGDTVNIAARLEAHTKEVGRGILLDGDTRGALEERVPLENLGTMQFKGKAGAVAVFAVKAKT
jgi:class 3 adenylate cyclase